MNTLREQLIEAQIASSGLFSEILVSDDNDYLLVEFEYNEKYDGLEFNACFDLPTHFSGDVIQLNKDNNNCYVIPFDPECFDNIYHYFEQLSDEINEGYLCPNQLFFGDE